MRYVWNRCPEYDFKILVKLELAISEFIKCFNKQKIITKLKGLMPVQYRNQSLVSI